MIVSALICGVACDKDNAGSELQSVEELYQELETAYQVSSTDGLEKFFKEWNISVTSNTSNNQDNVTKVINEIYKDFYKPLDLTSLGDWEWGNSLNSNSKYVAVQNRIDFAILDEELFDIYFYQGIYESIKFDSICDFRPPLTLEKGDVLYLTPEYQKALNMFLGTQSRDENGVLTPSMPKEDSDKRYAFIRPFIPILHGHRGGYWHLATHPEIMLLFVDTNHGAAKIFFRVGYMGGEATLKKKSNGWYIEESQATWIE